MGLRRVAEEEARRLDPDSKALYQAYCRGINYYMSNFKSKWPLEFLIVKALPPPNLRWRPAPWEIADSLVFGKVMALSLSTNWNSELVRALLPDLGHCWERIANIRIRMQGTVAGNLLALMPSYEGPILLSALDASLLYSTSESLNASAALTEFGDASDSFFLSRGLIAKVRVPLPPKGTTRRLVYDRSLRPFLSVALRIDHADGVVAAARAVVGGCHRWPFWCDLPVGGLSLPDIHAQADSIAIAAVRQMPPPTVPWFGLAHYREKVAPVLLSRLVREIAS